MGSELDRQMGGMAEDVRHYTKYLPHWEDKPSFLRLARQMATLTSAALSLKEGLWGLKSLMERDAESADRLAEQCAAAEVEPRFTALIHEAGTALREVADASGDLADAADQMEINARAFCDAHRAEYAGVYEAVNASGVQQAKPGFYRTR